MTRALWPWAIAAVVPLSGCGSNPDKNRFAADDTLDDDDSDDDDSDDDGTDDTLDDDDGADDDDSDDDGADDDGADDDDSDDDGDDDSSDGDDDAPYVRDETIIDQPKYEPPLCNLTRVWSTAEPVDGFESVRADVLHEVSPDGRFWIFSVKEPLPFTADAGDESDAGMLASDAGVLGTEDELDAGVADGGAPGFVLNTFIAEADQAPKPLELPGEYDINLGVSFNGSRRELIVTRADESGFALVKLQNDGTLSEPDATLFQSLAVTAGFSGFRLRNPTFTRGKPDQQLYFSAFSAATHRFSRAKFQETHWALEVSDPLLFSTLEFNRDNHVSSMSADGKTAFLWHAERGFVIAVELNDEGVPNQQNRKLNATSPVFVDKKCERLFSLDEESRFVVMRSESPRYNDAGVPIQP